MRFFTLFVMFAVIASAFCQVPQLSDETKAKVKKTVDECKAETNLNAEDIAKVDNKDWANPSDNLKCLANCILEKMGALKDGVVQKESIQEKLGPIVGEEVAMKAIEKCGSIQGANNCDTAYQILSCIKEGKSQILA